MAASKRVYSRIPVKPGLEQGGNISQYLAYDPNEKEFWGMPSSDAAKLLNPPLLDLSNLYNIAALTTYNQALGIEGGTVQYGANGLIFTGAADNNDNVVNSARTEVISPTADNGVIIYANALVYCTDITNGSWSFGLGTPAYLDAAANDPTTGVYLHKVKATGVITGKVRYNGGTTRATGTLQTLTNAKWIRLGLRAWFDLDGASVGVAKQGGYFTTTTPAASPGACGQCTVTPFTTLQLTELYNIFHNTPTMGAWFATVAAGATVTATVRGGVAGVRR